MTTTQFAVETTKPVQAIVAADLPDDDNSAGPGWFDSSWDLASGLVVVEGLPHGAQLADWAPAGACA